MWFTLENSMERDKFMSPIEAQQFGILDKILDHPPRFSSDVDAQKTNGSTDPPKEQTPTVA